MYYEVSLSGEYCMSGPRDLCVILSNKKNPAECDNGFYRYQVNIWFSPEVDGGDLYEVALWCEENCSGDWLAGAETSAFIDELDVVAFKLRWL